MTKNEQELDNVFREKLHDYEVSPPADVWQNISTSLTGKRKRVLPIFFRYAAALLVLVASGFLINSMLDKVNNEFTYNENDEPKTMAERAPETTKELTENNNNSFKITSNGTEPEKLIAQKNKEADKTITKNENSEPNYFSKADELKNSIPTTYENDKNVSEPSFVENKVEQRYNEDKLSHLVSIDASFRTINEPMLHQIKQKSNIIIPINDEIVVLGERDGVDKEFNELKWSLGGQVAPIYAYRTITTNNLSGNTSKEFNSNESPLLAYGGGLSIKVMRGKRLSISSGIYYSQMGQNISNAPVILTSNEMFSSINNISPYANSAGPINNSHTKSAEQQDKFYALPPVLQSSKELDFTTSTRTNYEKADLKQVFNFIEIPLIVRYRLTSGKTGLNLIGGVNTNLLVSNKVEMLSDNYNQDIGETAGLKPISYSSTMGIGLDYLLNSQLRFNLEPVFKYHLSSLNESDYTTFRPYAFGLYTGISFIF